MFDIKNGVIAVESLRKAVSKVSSRRHAGSNSLHGEMYHVNNLMQHFPDIDKSFLPIFVYLHEHDFAESDTVTCSEIDIEGQALQCLALQKVNKLSSYCSG